MTPRPYRDFDLNLLVVFSAVLEEGNLTYAAEKLNLTQSAVSHALARLRDVFQDPLFVRTGRTMSPTPMARRMSDRVRGALQTLASLQEAGDFDPTAEHRVFRLALRDVLEAVILPPLMAELERIDSPIEITSVQTVRSDLEREMRRGAIDLAVDAPFVVGEEIIQRSLAQVPLVVVARYGHPIVQDVLDLESYMAQDHVVVSTRRSGPGLADVELNRLGLRRRVKLRCQHYFAACRVVSQSNLLLTMPGHYAQVMAGAIPNQLLEFPLALPRLDAVMYWHVSVEDDPASRWLRGRIESIMSAVSMEGG